MIKIKNLNSSITIPGYYNPNGYTFEEGLKSVGSGWSSLIELAFEELKKYPDFKIVQVKEKFGKLRIYFDEIFDKNMTKHDFKNKDYQDFYQFLLKLELKSKEICENCGKKGKLIEKNGWLITSCAKCFDNKS